MVLEYDGTAYQGFQLQAKASTVQGQVEEAIYCLTGQRVRIKAAGRTDAGAHALGQVVAFITESRFDGTTYVKALNYYLPPDIRVRKAQEVPLDFDPRRQATSRVYRYTILNQETPPALLRYCVHWLPDPMDIEEINTAASYLIGTHDFRAFASPLPPGKSSVRQVHRWEVWREDNRVIMEAEANAFLPHQVRKTGAVLVAVGRQRLPVEAIPEALDGERSLHQWAPLPARGLCLVEVKYPNFSIVESRHYEYAKV